MKDSKTLAELKNDAGNFKSENIKELIKLGKTRWYRGCPVDSPDKVIALRLETGITIQFNEEDIIAVEKQDHFYIIQVKEGTNYVASFQTTAQVSSQTDACECTSQSISKNEGDATSNTIVPLKSQASNIPELDDIFRPPGLGFYFCYNEPYLTERCFNYRDKCGNWKRFCIPYWTTREVCRWV